MSSAQRQPGGSPAATSGSSVRGQLPLQRLGLGAHDDAAAGGGAGERRRQQVGEALAHAGPGLEQADAAAREDVGGGLGVVDLAGAAAEAGEAAGEAGHAVAGRRRDRRRRLRPAPRARRRTSTGRTASGPGPLRRLVGDQRRRRLVGRRGAGVEHGERRPGDALEQAPLHVGQAGGAPREVREHAPRWPRRPAARGARGHARPSSSTSIGSAWRSSSGYSSSAASSVSNQASGERRRAAAPRRRRQVLAVEGGVVPDERSRRRRTRAGRRGPPRSAGAPATSASEMPVSRVTNSGMRHARVDQRREAVGDREVRVQAHGADVDDAVARRGRDRWSRCRSTTNWGEGGAWAEDSRAARACPAAGRPGRVTFRRPGARRWPRRPWWRRGRGARPGRRRRRRPA